MDNLTHTLTGLLLARAGAGGLARYATPTLLVAANIPDVDMLYFLGGTESYLAHHRTWSHSFLGAAVLGAAVGLAFWSRVRRAPQRHQLAALLGLGAAGGLSHSLLDWATPYGTQLAWPVNTTWYALDWFPIIDFWLLLVLLLGLALPALFRLIGEEIGARPSGRGRRWGARVALVAMLLLAGARGAAHQETVAQLEARLHQGRTPLRVGAFPVPLNPFRWDGVVETDTTYELVEMNLLAGSLRDNVTTLYKPAASEALQAALAGRTAGVFLDWARFPYARVTPWGEGWQIEMQDLRYSPDPNRPRVFVVRVEVGRNLKVLEEKLYFARFGQPVKP